MSASFVWQFFAAANFSWTCVDPVRTKGPLFTCAIRFGSLANEFHHLKQRESETTTLDVCSKDAEDNEILQKLMLDISRTAIVGERHTFDCIGLII